jgi:two-component system NtrC family sensor kinase
MASKSKMEQVFINLFLNAVHALKHLKGNKVIELGLKKKNSQSVTIFVKDNGCGISKENMRNLFTPFFTTRFSEGGSGLGLSIVYGIIHEHNGRIRARSKENSGTEFIITLPLAN